MRHYRDVAFWIPVFTVLALLMSCSLADDDFKVTDRLIATLKRDEGVRDTLYKDSLGNLTVGVGHDVDANPLHPSVMKRLESGGKLSTREINKLLDSDIEIAVAEAKWVFAKAWTGLSQERREVIVNMAFNLGERHLREFVRFRAAIDRHDYVEAAKEMLTSRWASEVGARAVRLANVMRTNDAIHFNLRKEN